MENSFVRSLLASVLVLAFVSAVVLMQGKEKAPVRDVTMQLIADGAVQR